MLRVKDATSFTQYLDRNFPGRHDVATAGPVGNVRRYRDSKAGKGTAAGVVLLRGRGMIDLNGEAFDLGYATERFGCAAALRPTVRAPRLATVENLDSFLRAEAVLGQDRVYLHPYGRIGSGSFAGLESDDILHFGDYDYVGLDEYLRLKSAYPQLEFHLPAALDAYWERYARPLKRDATITARVRESQDPAVLRVRTLLETTNHFLEQQALFLSLNDQP